MRKVLLVVLVLVAAAGAVGYWRGWFIVHSAGSIDVQVDQGRFRRDRDAFRTSVGAKAQAMKEQVAGLWKKTEVLSGDEQSAARKEIEALKAKHERLEAQIQELEGAGEERFEGVKQDLAKSLEDVEGRIKDLDRKMEQSKSR